MELIINTLIWAAVFQGLLMGILFIFSKKHRSFSNRLLGFFLIIFIFGAISDLIPFDFIGKYNVGLLFSTPEVKLLFPVLFLHYVLEKIGRTNDYRKFLAAQYILALGILSITIINVILFLVSGISIYDLINRQDIHQLYMLQQYYAFLLSITVFTIAIIETLKYRNIARNEYSDSTMLSINWLWQFIFILVPVILLWGAELLRIILGGKGQSDIVVVTWVFVAIFNYFVSYKAFTRQDLFTYAERKTNHIKPKTTAAKQEESKTTDNTNVCKEIRSAMETQQFYLQHDLSIHDFAKAIDTSPRLISSCINQNFGYNFNEWINNYRVAKALEILKDPQSDHLSIEGVGTEAGFKSRSAMYTAFKRKTGETPGFFRAN
jgi:AraC-like DNA-binding protein